MWEAMDWNYIVNKLNLKHKAVKKIPAGEVSKNIIAIKHIGSKPFNTYTGLALLDEHGDVVDKSMFSDSIKMGVGNTMQINWNIEIIK